MRRAPRCIPAAVRAAYPAKQTHIVHSLGTADRCLTKVQAHVEPARIDASIKLERERPMRMPVQGMSMRLCPGMSRFGWVSG